MPDERHDGATTGSGPLASAQRRMTAHRFFTFAFVTLGGYPCRMRLKENNRRSLGIRHDRQLLSAPPANCYNSGYRIVIPECPPNPETKPPTKMRIGREFDVIREPLLCGRPRWPGCDSEP
ncbi:MAG: hypothetical protein JOZ00_22895 [Mycobacterium sp.]|nr:hypothetical protein [Mycobacterium sp.]